jgi:hypothetical protein
MSVANQCKIKETIKEDVVGCELPVPVMFDWLC